MNNIANEYYLLAVKLCDYFKDITLDKNNINDVIILISNIYAKGLLLPNVEPETITNVFSNLKYRKLKLIFQIFIGKHLTLTAPKSPYAVIYRTI